MTARTAMRLRGDDGSQGTMGKDKRKKEII